MDLLKYLFEKPALSGRLSRWLILLAEFDLKYVVRKTIKESIVSDFYAENPIEGEDGKEDFPDGVRNMEDVLWQSCKPIWKGIGILLITLEGSHIPLAIKLNFEATNNMAEYKACIAGMEAFQELRVKEAEIFGDSTLVIAQAQKLWKVKEEHMKPYQKYLEDLTKTFN